MKLLVQENLSTVVYDDSDYTAEESELEEEFWEFIRSLLDGYSVTYRLDYDPDIKGYLFEIPVQKITLDEQGMNELFYECLHVLLDYRVEYSALGGKGCGFSLCLYQK